jgi:hypothetical protein
MGIGISNGLFCKAWPSLLDRYRQEPPRESLWRWFSAVSLAESPRVGGSRGELRHRDRPILEMGAAALLSATQVTLVAGIRHRSVGCQTQKS